MNFAKAREILKQELDFPFRAFRVFRSSLFQSGLLLNAKLLYKIGDQAGPSGLVACAQTGAGITI